MDGEAAAAPSDALSQRYTGEVLLGVAPALLLVDFTAEFLYGPEMSDQLPCDPASAVAHATALLAAARAAEVSVVWTRNTVESPHGRESWTWTHGRDHALHPRAGEIVELPADPDDFVVNKTKPSAFFSTPLLSYLVARRIDTLLVCGGTTSGCVRATVVDAFSYNYRVGLLPAACFDRDAESHRVTVKDLGAKYCRVISGAEADNYLSTLPQRDR